MAAIPSFFSVGPQPFDQLGVCTGFALIFVSAIPGPGRLSPTNFVSVRPQVIDTGRASGYASITRAAIAGSGAAPSSRYRYGTHAEALYNAEAVKSQTWRSVRTASLSGNLAAWFSAAPQQVDLTQQPFVDGPQPGGSLPGVMTVVSSAPQQVDLTQQPFFDAPLVGATPGGLVPADIWTYGSHATATYNAEAGKTQIWRSVVSRSTGLLGTWISSSPQGVDFTQQTDFSAPLTIGAISPVAPFFSSAPQRLDLTQQPFFDTPQPAGARSRVAPYFTAAPQQIDLTQQAFYDSPVVVGPGPFISAEWSYGLHSVDMYNAEAVKTRVWSSAVASTVAVSGKLGAWVSSVPQYVDPPQADYSLPLVVQGWVLTYISAQPDTTEYPTIRGFLTHSAVPGPPVSSPVVSAFVSVPPQFEERPTVIVRSAQQAGSTPRIIPVTAVSEQSYVNSQPLITHAAIASGGPLLGTVVGVGQQAYVDVQPRLYPTVVTGSTLRVSAFFSVGPIDPSQLAAFYDAPQTLPPPTFGPVLPWVFAAPQQFDFTQQPFWDVPQPGPLKGPVPPLLVASPQYVDLTLQGSFSRPLIIGQGILGSFASVPPQQFDHTLPSHMFVPLAAQIVYVVRAPERVELSGYGRRIVLADYK